MNWLQISTENGLSDSFLEEHAHKIDWEHVSKLPSLSEEFIEKWKEELDWYFISHYQKLSLSFIQKNREYIVLNALAENTYITEEMIEAFSEDWLISNWNAFSEYATLSEEFIETYAENWNWLSLSCFQDLSLSFIKKHAKKLPWLGLTRNPHLDFTKEQWDELREIFTIPFINTSEPIHVAHTNVETLAKSFQKTDS